MLTQLQSLSHELREASLETRMQTFAHHLLGVEYGGWQDGSDLESMDDFNYKLDVLDCVTYVELVLALAKTDPEHDFINLLRHIHYANGTPNFVSRNHFFGLDWIRNNQYVIEDQTLKIGRNVKTAEALIDKINWLRTNRKIQNIPDHLLNAWPPSIETVPYVPTLELLDNQTRYFKAFPEYAICCIVRPNWDLREKIGTHLNISHLGLVFKDHITQTLRFYHASGSTDKQDQNSPRQVVTLDLCEYMASYIDSPTIAGLNVLGIKPDYYYF